MSLSRVEYQVLADRLDTIADFCNDDVQNALEQCADKIRFGPFSSNERRTITRIENCSAFLGNETRHRLREAASELRKLPATTAGIKAVPDEQGEF